MKYDTTLAVDPSSTRSGFALFDGPLVVAGAVEGVENVGALKLWANDLGRVRLIVEYPVWRGKGGEVVRAAANCWIRAAKRAWPRLVTVVKIRPDQWQNPLGVREFKSKANPEPRKPETLYRPFAARVFNCRELPADESAALCILEAHRRGLV